MGNFLKLSNSRKIELFNNTALITGLPNIAVEKDWWITVALRALFSLPYFEYLSFKGGTSLSKCWKLVDRFSEDIDIAIDREYLGFKGTLSKTQISNQLRRATCSFVREKMQFDLKNQLEIIGINKGDFNIVVHITPITTTDPEIIEIEYKTLFNEVSYIKHKIIIEVSGRSMAEPVEVVFLKSMIDEAYNETNFSEPSFAVNAVIPERTFIEKICLLHEEFAKPTNLIRKDRMSRHLYDLAQMSESYVVSKAIKNSELFNAIIEHRRVFIGLSGFDYDSLMPKNINIVPPSNIIDQWEIDYRNMQETMIYGHSPTFENLIEKIVKLNKEINQIV